MRKDFSKGVGRGFTWGRLGESHLGNISQKFLHKHFFLGVDFSLDKGHNIVYTTSIDLRVTYGIPKAHLIE